MAQSKSTKKLFNMAYGLGASIVIIGALFKILHPEDRYTVILWATFWRAIS